MTVSDESAKASAQPATTPQSGPPTNSREVAQSAGEQANFLSRPWSRAWVRRVSGVVGGLVMAAVTAQVTGFHWSSLWVRATKADPVSITASRYRDSDQSLTVAFPSNLSGLPVPNATADGGKPLEDFISQHGGVDVGFTHVVVELKGKSDKAVISNIHPVIVSSGPPLGQTLFWGTPEGEASIPQIGFDLDDPKGVARRVTGLEAPNWLLPARQIFVQQLAAPYFNDKLITLDPGELFRVNIVAETTSHFYRWKLSFDVETGSSRKTITVGDGPNPFQTTSLAPTVNTPNSGSYQAIYFTFPDKAGWKNPRTFCAFLNNICRTGSPDVAPMPMIYAY